MILIFGGAYQGKTDFARKTFGLSNKDIFDCGELGCKDACAKDGKGSWKLCAEAREAKAICGLEKAFLAFVKAGVEPKAFLAEHKEQLKDKIMIINDISQGVVPVDPDLRAWREAVGRAMLWMASESDQVYRVFCGMEQRLK